MTCVRSRFVRRRGVPGKHEIYALGAQRSLELEGQKVNEREVAIGVEGQGWAGEERFPNDIKACRETGRRFLAGPVSDCKEADVSNGKRIA